MKGLFFAGETGPDPSGVGELRIGRSGAVVHQGGGPGAVGTSPTARGGYPTPDTA